MAAFDLLAPTIVSPYHPDDPEGLFAPYSRFEWSGGVLTAEFDQRQYGNDLLYVYFLVPVDPETGDFLEWMPTVLDATVRATEPSGVVQDIKVTAALSTGGGYSSPSVYLKKKDEGWKSPFDSGVAGSLTLTGFTDPYWGYQTPMMLRFDFQRYPFATYNGTIELLALSADVAFPGASEEEDDPGFATGRLYKQSITSYVPGTPGRPGVPAVPAVPGYWAEEEFFETWYEESTVGYDRVPVYGTDSEGNYGIIGYQNYPRLIWIKVEKAVKRPVWHPPVPGVPGIPAVPPIPTQVISDRQLGWNASAEGVLRATGDLRFEFKTDTENYGAVIGLSDPAEGSAVTYATIRYAFYLTTNTYRVMESGVEVTAATAFEPGTLFAIVRHGKAIRYYAGGVLITTSSKTSLETELQPDAAFYAGDDNIYAYRLLEGRLADLSGQRYGALAPLRQLRASGSTGSGISRSVNQAFAPLKSRGGLVSDRGGMARDQALPALIGFAAEQAPNYARSRFPALRQLKGEGGRGSLGVLRGFGGARGGVAEHRGRLRALTSEAWSLAGTTHGTGRLPALRGFGSEEVRSFGKAAFPALRGEAGEYAAGKSGGTGRLGALRSTGWAERRPAFSQSQRLAALVSKVGVGVDQGGRARLAPLIGFASEEAVARGHGRLPALRSRVGAGVDAGARSALPALRGLAFEEAQGFSRLQRLAPLTGQAKGPGVAGGGNGRLAALTSSGIALGGETRGRGAFPALRAQGGTWAGRSYGQARFPALWGIASDSARFAWGRGRLTALQGQAEGGFIVPPRPVEGAGWFPALVSKGHGYVRSGYGSGSLGPLRGLGSDHTIAVQRTARLAPLGHLWSGEYDPPTVCVRYIPRLWAAAMGERAGFGASLPIGLDVALVEGGGEARTRLDTWITHPTALQASLSAHIAWRAHRGVDLGVVVAKPGRRQMRVNAWITQQHTLSASFDAAIEP